MSQAMPRRTAPRACEAVQADLRSLGELQVHRRRGPLLFALVHWLADQRRRRAVIRQLTRLSDHHLCDIGIERGEIDAVADTLMKRWRAGRR